MFLIAQMCSAFVAISLLTASLAVPKDAVHPFTVRLAFLALAGVFVTELIYRFFIHLSLPQIDHLYSTPLLILASVLKVVVGLSLLSAIIYDRLRRA